MAWRCIHRPEEVLLGWPDEQQVVFFNPATGDTHLLSAMAGLLAECLAAQALDVPALLQRIRESLAHEAAPDLEACLREHLRRLSAVGLLQECSA